MYGTDSEARIANDRDLLSVASFGRSTKRRSFRLRSQRKFIPTWSRTSFATSRLWASPLVRSLSTRTTTIRSCDGTTTACWPSGLRARTCPLALSQDREQAADHCGCECGYTDAVKHVPAVVSMSGLLGECAGIELHHAVVDWHEKQQREDDHGCPDGVGNDQRGEARFVATEKGLREQQQQAGCVPERHRPSEPDGEQACRGCLCAFVEPRQDWIDEDGDRKLRADQQTDADDDGDLQDEHETPPACEMFGEIH